MNRPLFKQLKTLGIQFENFSLKMLFRLVVIAFVVCSLHESVQVSEDPSIYDVTVLDIMP